MKVVTLLNVSHFFFSIILDFNIIYNYIFINIAKWSKVTELFDIKKI
jgi:hypothetical protein